MDKGLIMTFDKGRKKALTFSYDDGTIHDRKLVSLMNGYGMKGTFNLNSGLLAMEESKAVIGGEVDFSRVQADEVKALYAGHEVAAHGLLHPSLPELPDGFKASEILKDRENLERLTEELVRGFAYPYGTYDEETEKVLAACGIEYARTVHSTKYFEIPWNFLEWHPTCHHDDPETLTLLEQFCREENWNSKIFYLWGHSFEFECNDNWHLIEGFMKYAADYRDKIWFATNLEIVDYIKAFRQLRSSADGKTLYNPTGLTLWFEWNGEIHCIHGNETYRNL